MKKLLAMGWLIALSGCGGFKCENEVKQDILSPDGLRIFKREASVGGVAVEYRKWP